MCGRYAYFTSEEYKEIKKITQMIDEKYDEGHVPDGEIYPTNTVPVLLAGGGEKKIDAELIQWGFNGIKSSRPIINARAETVDEKRMFANSFKKQRCIIPTTGFYEWAKNENGRTKYLFRLPDEHMVYLAGIYNEFDDVKKFVILTTSANNSMADVHNRMPVIIKKNYLHDWVYNRKYAEFLIKDTPPALVKKAI